MANLICKLVGMTFVAEGFMCYVMDFGDIGFWLYVIGVVLFLLFDVLRGLASVLPYPSAEEEADTILKKEGLYDEYHHRKI